MIIYTLGFTKKSAEQFFEILKASGAKRVVDVRLNNVSQLAGFSKRDDLRYFLRSICGLDYRHVPDLAPTQEMLDQYRKEKSGWENYERKFRQLLVTRAVENSVAKELLDGSCLLCSEPTPEHCHRRVVAEYLSDRWGGVTIKHL
jgi:uncharacterized protein (DUF488 family)